MLRGLFGGAAALALILSAGIAQSQDFSAERISEDIRHISADDFQGRYPGTEGERMTLAWLQAQYEAIGLQPGGPDGQWRVMSQRTQEAPLCVAKEPLRKRRICHFYDRNGIPRMDGV